MHNHELSVIKMNKKIIKYVSTIVLGLVTLFWGLVTYVAFLPPMEEYPCEAGQEDLSPIYCAIITFAAMIVFCFVWYKTKNL
jgi:membrane protease YdiL (CAAX protease family)